MTRRVGPADLRPDGIRAWSFGLIGWSIALGDHIANVDGGVGFTVATPAADFIFAGVSRAQSGVALFRGPTQNESWPTTIYVGVETECIY